LSVKGDSRVVTAPRFRSSWYLNLLEAKFASGSAGHLHFRS